MTKPILRGFGFAGILLVSASGMTTMGSAKPVGEAVAPLAVPASLGSGPAAVQEHPGKQEFTQYCAPCHGPKGKGNGPAAAAFNPPPADFTNPDGVPRLTDEQVIEVITKGRGFMPAWGAILTQEQVGRLLAYIRELSRGEG